MLRDYLALRFWDGGRLRLGKREGRAKPAYIVSLSGLLYSIKTEAMLGKAFQLKGLKPIVVTSRNAWWPQRFFRAFGITDFVFLDDVHVTDADYREAQAVVANVLVGELSFPQVKIWSYEGAPIGQYALSTVARMLHRGMPNLRDERTLSALRSELVKTIVNIRRARRLIESLDPGECWLFNEINYNDYGPLFFASFERGNNIIQFTHALRDRALIFKRLTRDTYRVHPNSVDQITLKGIVARPWTSTHKKLLDAEFDDRYGGRSWIYRRDQEGARIKTVKEVRSQLKLDPLKKTAVVYSHILWDANLFYGEDLFDDNEHWFVETLKVACRNDRVNWVVKLHPAIKWKMEWDGSTDELNEEVVIRDKIGPLPAHVKLIYPNTDINTLSLLRVTDIGVTIRGTVGIELAARGVPVLTAGTGRYSGLGFTVDPQSKEEYIDWLLRVDQIPPLMHRQLDLARRYAFTLFCLRPWVMSSFENIFDPRVRGFSQFNPRLELRAKSNKEIENAADLRKFASWAVDDRSVDYVEPWPA